MKYQIELQQYPDSLHVCIADQDGNFIADFGSNDDPLSISNARFFLFYLPPHYLMD